MAFGRQNKEAQQKRAKAPERVRQPLRAQLHHGASGGGPRTARAQLHHMGQVRVGNAPPEPFGKARTVSVVPFGPAILDPHGVDRANRRCILVNLVQQVLNICFEFFGVITRCDAVVLNGRSAVC